MTPERGRDGLREGRAVSARFYDPLMPGTLVLAWPGSRDSAPLVTRTRSEVWTLSSGERVVMVEGHAGGIALTHIDVLPTAEHPATRDEERGCREKESAWDEGWRTGQLWAFSDLDEHDRSTNPYRAERFYTCDRCGRTS
jgi:hypothetical protein